MKPEDKITYVLASFSSLYCIITFYNIFIILIVYLYYNFCDTKNTPKIWSNTVYTN